MSIKISELADYMKHGVNVYLFGEAGTGKTHSVEAAAELAGMKLGYFSAPTLDAYIDLIGMPTIGDPKETGKKFLEFIRKQEFEDVEVLFIDELPRGELKTLNAIFELIQFGTINGERAIPNLKTVFAAGNPMTEDYVGQNQLDRALLDRFDVYIETKNEPDLNYFVSVFGPSVGTALVNWHKGHNKVTDGYLSPRRLEKIGKLWLKFQNVNVIKGAIPPGCKREVNDLHASLKKATNSRGSMSASSLNKLVKEINDYTILDIKRERKRILSLLSKANLAEIQMISSPLATHMVNDVLINGVEATFNDWKDFVPYWSLESKNYIAGMLSGDVSSATFFSLLSQENVKFGSKLANKAR